MNTDLLQEFKLDWSLSGKAPRTAELYVGYLTEFFSGEWSPTLADAKMWLLSTEHLSVRRKRAALRDFHISSKSPNKVDSHQYCEDSVNHSVSCPIIEFSST